MNFLEDVGQRYLERKAFSVPQQLENVAKKQFQPTADQEKRGKEAPNVHPTASDKDLDIAKLRKQLAESKVGKQSPARKTRNQWSLADMSRSAKSPTRPATKRSNAAESRHAGSTHEVLSQRPSIASYEIAAHRHAANSKASPSRGPSVHFESPHTISTKHAKAPQRSPPHETQKVKSVQIESAKSPRHERREGGSKPNVYAIQVEEDAPKRRRTPSRDVIEVRSAPGRTVYRVR